MLIKQNFKGKPKILNKVELDFQAHQAIIVKNISWSCALKNLPKELLPILKNIENHLQYKNKYITVDFKIHYLKKGECPCIPGWHLDTQMDITKGQWENHFLFVMGENSLTEFIDQDIKLNLSNRKKQAEILKDYQNQLNNMQFKPFSLPEKTIVQYSRDAFHRGSPAISDGWRLLIRVSEQDFFPPIKTWRPKKSKNYK